VEIASTDVRVGLTGFSIREDQGGFRLGSSVMCCADLASNNKCQVPVAEVGRYVPLIHRHRTDYE